VVSKITLILEILGDGKWHQIDKLQQEADLTEHQIEEVTMFLNQYGFLKIDRINEKVRITKSVKEFLIQKTT
jgi:hypothetical protein